MLEVVGQAALLQPLFNSQQGNQTVQVIDDDDIYFEALKQYTLKALGSLKPREEMPQALSRLFNKADGNTRLLSDRYLGAQGKSLLPPHVVSHIDRFEGYLNVANKPPLTSMLRWIRDLIPLLIDFYESFLQDNAIKQAVQKAKNSSESEAKFDFCLVTSLSQLIGDAAEEKMRGNYPSNHSLLGGIFQQVFTFSQQCAISAVASSDQNDRQKHPLIPF